MLLGRISWPNSFFRQTQPLTGGPPGISAHLRSLPHWCMGEDDGWAPPPSPTMRCARVPYTLTCGTTFGGSVFLAGVLHAELQQNWCTAGYLRPIQPTAHGLLPFGLRISRLYMWPPAPSSFHRQTLRITICGRGWERQSPPLDACIRTRRLGWPWLTWYDIFLRTSGCNQMAIKWLILHPLMQPASPLYRQPNRSSGKVNVYGGARWDGAANQTYGVWRPPSTTGPLRCPILR
jgi:hypothetical protein